MLRLPPLGSIQALVQVARLGSIKAAADALALSSPALTRRIQGLEDFVGTPLLERSNSRVRLNARGKTFFDEVEPHVDALAFAIERMSAPGQAMRLRVAVPSLFASQRLMPALRSLRLQHPNLHIDVDTGPDRLSKLGDGVDAAIAIAERVDGKIYSRMLEKGRIIAIASRELGRGAEAIGEPNDVRRFPILLHRDMPQAFEAWRAAIGIPDLEPAATSYFDSGQLILDAAAEGLGIAFMTESHLACSTDGRLTRYFDRAADSPYAYWFACPHAALDRRPVKIFHNWLFRHFAASSHIAIGDRAAEDARPPDLESIGQ